MVALFRVFAAVLMLVQTAFSSEVVTPVPDIVAKITPVAAKHGLSLVQDSTNPRLWIVDGFCKAPSLERRHDPRGDSSIQNLVVLVTNAEINSDAVEWFFTSEKPRSVHCAIDTDGTEIGLVPPEFAACAYLPLNKTSVGVMLLVGPSGVIQTAQSSSLECIAEQMPFGNIVINPFAKKLNFQPLMDLFKRLKFTCITVTPAVMPYVGETSKIMLANVGEGEYVISTDGTVPLVIADRQAFFVAPECRTPEIDPTDPLRTFFGNVTGAVSSKIEE